MGTLLLETIASHKTSTTISTVYEHAGKENDCLGTLAGNFGATTTPASSLYGCLSSGEVPWLCYALRLYGNGSDSHPLPRAITAERFKSSHWIEPNCAKLCVVIDPPAAGEIQNQ